MGYKCFEDLPVWRDAIELAIRVFEITAKDRARFPSGFRDQIERAVVSISNNVAEGFERGTNQELIAFLYIAKGSAGEVRSMLHLLDRFANVDPEPASLRPGQASLPPEIAGLKGRAHSISRQLGAWIESLKNSELKGPRYCNDASRAADERARRRDTMLTTLERYRAAAPGLHSRPPVGDDSES